MCSSIRYEPSPSKNHISIGEGSYSDTKCNDPALCTLAKSLMGGVLAVIILGDVCRVTKHLDTIDVGSVEIRDLYGVGDRFKTATHGHACMHDTLACTVLLLLLRLRFQEEELK